MAVTGREWDGFQTRLSHGMCVPCPTLHFLPLLPCAWVKWYNYFALVQSPDPAGLNPPCFTLATCFTTPSHLGSQHPHNLVHNNFATWFTTPSQPGSQQPRNLVHNTLATWFTTFSQLGSQHHRNLVHNNLATWLTTFSPLPHLTSRGVAFSACNCVCCPV